MITIKGIHLNSVNSQNFKNPMSDLKRSLIGFHKVNFVHMIINRKLKSLI